MTEAEERTYFSLWCLLKAPLLMGNDLRNMSAQTLAIYGAEEVVKVDQTWGGAIGCWCTGNLPLFLVPEACFDT